MNFSLKYLFLFHTLWAVNTLANVIIFESVNVENDVQESNTQSNSKQTTVATVTNSGTFTDANVSPKLSCYSCNSNTTGLDCFGRLAKARGCESHSGKCYTFIGDGTVIRGCVGDKIIPDASYCDDPTVCSICSHRSGCNYGPIISEVCISYEPNTTTTTSTVCPLTLKPSGCFHMENDGILHRKGCVNELTRDETMECSDSNNASCKICFGKTCNIKNTLNKCLICHSQTDPNCVSNTTAVQVKVCPAYENKCYTLINDDKTVQRGCADKDENFIRKCYHSNSQCDICSNHVKNVCNDNHLLDTCIVCDSSTDPLCRKQPEQIKDRACSVNPLKNTDGCYLDSSDGKITRGCVRNLQYSKQFECRSGTSQCKSCNGANCNKKVSIQQKCYSCNGTEDMSCQTKSSDTIFCQKYASSCFVGIDGNGFTHRGCITPQITSNDKFDKRQFPKALEICYDDLCNGVTLPENRFKCYQCEGEDCKDFKEKSKICRIFADKDECYAYLSADGIEYRGCMSDLSELKTLAMKSFQMEVLIMRLQPTRLP
ncbi:uncharacterized protein LOC129570749 isoform X2 [Sitodiplosis mosellana]|uniref:uncharacterized protein LOC129570749 isoform X2 n=1 Tax=Sitodiplosis mosellana TaxID=263140 RepID=UPI002443BDB7|nr:uncharacterized protein LOC129570749 isoform X2 [Sitodiplosis mosellana]